MRAPIRSSGFQKKRVDDHCLFWIKGPKKNKGAFSQGTLQQTNMTGWKITIFLIGDIQICMFKW